MASDLPESDWKAFRKLREVALGRFCERVLIEVGRVTSDAKRTSHARYLAAYELIQERDDQIARAFNNPRRTVAALQLATMMSLDLISQAELQSFTPRTQSVVEALRQPMRRARAIKSA
ncbi:MAG: hypothetical protein ACREVD_05500 [Burkholderiales bacterium]